MRKKRYIFQIILLLIVGTLILSQEKCIEINGFEWEKKDSNFKFGYVQGLEHGFQMTVSDYTSMLRYFYFWELDTVKELNNQIFLNGELFIFGASSEQMIDGVDEFYKDDANKLIPAYLLISLVCKKAYGLFNNEETEKELQKLRLDFRKKE